MNKNESVSVFHHYDLQNRLTAFIIVFYALRKHTEALGLKGLKILWHACV